MNEISTVRVRRGWGELWAQTNGGLYKDGYECSYQFTRAGESAGVCSFLLKVESVVEVIALKILGVKVGVGVVKKFFLLFKNHKFRFLSKINFEEV